MGVKIVLAIIWLLYIPFAIGIFGISGMASDSPATPTSHVMFVMLIANGIPLLVMLTASHFAIKRNSILISFSPPIVFAFLYVCLIVAVQFFGPQHY